MKVNFCTIESGSLCSPITKNSLPAQQRWCILIEYPATLHVRFHPLLVACPLLLYALGMPYSVTEGPRHAVSVCLSSNYYTPLPCTCCAPATKIRWGAALTISHHARVHA